MSGWLIPHPQRMRREVDGVVVFCDTNDHNQDPYIWNRRFLHSYCHITQMSPQVGDTCLWVQPTPFRAPEHLWCDLVLVVEKKVWWPEANRCEPTDDIVDSPAAYSDHFRWHTDHPLRRRHRFTLKAEMARSFQPQDAAKSLIDIAPILAQAGVTAGDLRAGLRAGFAGKPMRIADAAANRVAGQIAQAPIRLHGPDLEVLRRAHDELASPI